MSKKTPRKRAQAKPMRQGSRTVAALPHPVDRKAAEAEAKKLAKALKAGAAAQAEERSARARKDEQFAEAKRIAERLRLFVDENDLLPAVDGKLLELVDEATFAVEESKRESVFVDDEDEFAKEARRLGAFKLFVRVKEEPDLKSFALAANRKKASLFTSARIERERAIVIRIAGVEAPLKYVLNESEPAWTIESPRKT